MWPCENVGFTKTTIANNGRDYMDFIINKVRGTGAATQLSRPLRRMPGAARAVSPLASTCGG